MNLPFGAVAQLWRVLFSLDLHAEKSMCVCLFVRLAGDGDVLACFRLLFFIVCNTYTVLYIATMRNAVFNLECLIVMKEQQGKKTKLDFRFISGLGVPQGCLLVPLLKWTWGSGVGRFWLRRAGVANAAWGPWASIPHPHPPKCVLSLFTLPRSLWNAPLQTCNLNYAYWIQFKDQPFESQ